MEGGINWVEKVADWGWAVLLAVFAALGGGYIKLWRQHDRHHERLKALEDHHNERVRQVDHLTRTVEANRIEVSDKLDALGREIRQDLRDIQSALRSR